jgi:serine acetyltransferase
MPAAFFTSDFNTTELARQLTELTEYELSGCRETLQLTTVDDAKSLQSHGFAFAIAGSLSEDCRNSFIVVDEFPKSFDKGNIYCKVSDPRAVFIDCINTFMGKKLSPFAAPPFISPLASISKDAIIENCVSIGAGSSVAANAVIKSGVSIGSHCRIGEGVCIGNEGITRYRSADGRSLRFPHIAGVFVGNNVEIGANTVIPKGILSPTTIGDEVVIGNLCNVGHGATIGDGTWMSVGGLIGGHSAVGSNVTIGMGVRLRDNITIGANVSIGMGSVVTKSIPSGFSVFGNPAKKMRRLNTGPAR